MRKQIYVGLAVILAIMAFRHPMHVSVTEIEIDEEDKALKVVTHVFLDDIEKSYRMSKKNNELDITTEEVKPDFKKFLESYLSKNLQFAVNGKPAEANFLGYEVEENGLWCYMEALKIKKVKTLEVTNNLLLEVFEDQTNLVHVEYNDNVKSAKLDSKSTTYEFTLNE